MQQPLEQVAEAFALVLQAAQFLLDILVHRLLGQRPQALLHVLGLVLLKTGQGGLGEQVILEDMLQDIVDKGTIFRRCKARRLAGLRLESVAHKVAKVAGAVLVHAGG